MGAAFTEAGLTSSLAMVCTVSTPSVGRAALRKTGITNEANAGLTVACGTTLAIVGGRAGGCGDRASGRSRLRSRRRCAGLDTAFSEASLA